MSHSARARRDDGGEERTAQLTWYLAGRSASLSELLPMLQSTGVVVLEEQPFNVVRGDGMPVWIYQFKISAHQSTVDAPEAEREVIAARFADAVTAIWQGKVEIDRFNELVLGAGLTWQQVTILRAYAKYLGQAGFPYSQYHIETVLRDNPGTAKSLVELFEAVFDPAGGDAVDRAQAAAAAVAADIDARVCEVLLQQFAGEIVVPLEQAVRPYRGRGFAVFATPLLHETVVAVGMRVAGPFHRLAMFVNSSEWIETKVFRTVDFLHHSTVGLRFECIHFIPAVGF